MEAQPTLDSRSIRDPPDPSNKKLRHPSNTMTTAGGEAPSSTQPPDRHLPTPLMMHVLSFLPQNDLACSGRAAFKEAWLQLREPHQCTASMRHPLPPHVAAEWAAWAQPAQEALCQLPFNLKVRLLSTAASSGCETNLAVAWELVRPCLFLDVPDSSKPYLDLFKEHPGGYQERSPVAVPNPGTAAARAGHPELIPWLVRHGCPVDLKLAVAEVAEHCNLGQLQEAVAFVQGRDGEAAVKQCCVFALRGAAACRDHQEALAKVEWLHGVAGTGLGSFVAEATAAAGNLRLLQWLRGKGCQVAGRSVLAEALQHADLGVVQWLVDEAGVQLPSSRSRSERDDGLTDTWAGLCKAAAASGDVAKLRWLQAWGGTLHKGALCAAAKGGHLGVVRYLHEECGQRIRSNPDVFFDSVMSGRIEVVCYLLNRGHRMRHDNDMESYVGAAERGDVDMIRWLLEEAECPRHDDGETFEDDGADSIIRNWDYGNPASARRCVEVVRFMYEYDEEMPRDTDTLDTAASKGDLELVRYLHEEEGISFSAQTLACAAEGGCEALLEWLVVEGCPVPGPDNIHEARDPYVRACWAYQRSTLVCLRRLGVPWHSDGLARVISAKPWSEDVRVPMLQWLVQEGGVPVGPEALGKALAAAEKQRVGREVVAWLQGLVPGTGAE